MKDSVTSGHVPGGELRYPSNLENEDGDCNLNRKRCLVSSHHHGRDAELEAAPTTKDQEWGMGTEQ